MVWFQGPAAWLGDPGLITAKTFASLGSVWHVSVPSLEQFTRWVNSKPRAYARAVGRASEPNRSALIAEMAFVQETSSISNVKDAESAARALLARLPAPPEGGPLTADEKGEIRGLRRNLRTFVPRIDEPDEDSPIVNPPFPGCGFVLPAFGDILHGKHLLEVKTVERGFRGLDFRQTLTYCALGYAAGIEINRITLVNPRRAVAYTTTSSSLARDLGAASWIDLMHGLVNSMTEVNPSQ